MPHPVSGLGLEHGCVPLSVLCGGVCGGAVARGETDEHGCGERRTNDQPNIANGEHVPWSFSYSLLFFICDHFHRCIVALHLDFFCVDSVDERQ